MPTHLLETSIEIDAPAARVWRVFVEPALTRQMGGEYVTTWTPGAPFGWQSLDGQMLTSGALLQVEPEKLLQHSLFTSLPAQGDTPAVGSVITYTLHETAGRTTLAAREVFTHAIDDETYADALAGWQAALQAMKTIAEQPPP
jgi:uncharacterized protein YndB with AHSA1/START domain